MNQNKRTSKVSNLSASLYNSSPNRGRYKLCSVYCCNEESLSNIQTELALVNCLFLNNIFELTIMVLSIRNLVKIRNQQTCESKFINVVW